jgi:hypothetical protein
VRRSALAADPPVPGNRASIGITRLEHVADRSEAELLALHGFGPKALRVLREALAGQGRSMRPDRSSGWAGVNGRPAS